MALQGVPVESVVGDVVFWVGTNESDRTLVVLDLVLDEPETRTVITPGMTVCLSGTVEKLPSATEAPHPSRVHRRHSRSLDRASLPGQTPG